MIFEQTGGFVRPQGTEESTTDYRTYLNERGLRPLDDDIVVMEGAREDCTTIPNGHFGFPRS